MNYIRLIPLFGLLVASGSLWGAGSLTSNHANADTVSTTASGVTFTCVFPGAATNPSLFVIASRLGGGTSPSVSVTDSASNTWSQDVLSAADASGDFLAILHANNTSTSTVTMTINWTYSGGGNFIKRATCQEFSGMATSSPADQNNSATGASTSLTVTASGQNTQATEVVFSAGEVNTGSGQSFSAGDTTIEVVPASNTRLFSQYRTVTSTETSTASKTASASANWAMAVVTYKDTGGGGAATPHSLLTLGVGTVILDLFKWPVFTPPHHR